MSNETGAINTRGSLNTAVGLFIQDPSSQRSTMINTDLDRGYRQALRRFQWPQAIRWIDIAVSIASSSAYFFLPKDVSQLLRIINSTVPSVIGESGITEFVDHTGGFVTIGGIPSQFAQTGDSAINAILVAATALEVLSSTTDTRTGVIEGLLSSQVTRTTFTLTGTTPVALGTWDEVDAFYLASSDTAKTVTLRIVSGATAVATIGQNETKSVFKRYRIWPIPNMSTTLRAIYKYTPPSVLSSSHEYIIPIQDHLFEYAVGKALESRRQFAPAQQHLGEAEIILVNLWNEARGTRTEQYVPASPYWGMDYPFYIPVLGAW